MGTNTSQNLKEASSSGVYDIKKQEHSRHYDTRQKDPFSPSTTGARTAQLPVSGMDPNWMRFSGEQ